MPTLPTTPERESVHKLVIGAMRRMGYGLLTDGETFYQLGMELEPRSGITFSMRQAYVISTELKAQATELLGEVEKMIGGYEDYTVTKPRTKESLIVEGKNKLRTEIVTKLASLRSKWERSGDNT